jgi:hypothetical protein
MLILPVCLTGGDTPCSPVSQVELRRRARKRKRREPEMSRGIFPAGAAATNFVVNDRLTRHREDFVKSGG